MNRNDLRTFSYFSAVIYVFFLMGAVILHMSQFSVLFLFALLSVGAGAAVFFLTRMYYLNPLRLMKGDVVKAVRGEDVQPHGVFRQDEVGELARQIDEMAEEFYQQIDEAIREKEEIKAVLSGMLEGVIVIDAEDHVVHVSSSAHKMLDLRISDPVGRHYWEVVRHDEINSLLKEAIIERKPMEKDIVILNPEEVFFNVKLSPVLGLTGEVRSVVAVFHDVSAMKKYDQMRSEFVANVSHELKTPLTSIKGFVETIKSGAIDDRPQAMRFLDIIEKQTGRLENLVSDILSLSSIESAENRPDGLVRQPEAIARIIDGVVAIEKPRLQAHKHELSLDVQEGLPLVEVDRGKIEQVIMNLLDNAIKFTPEGGRIGIRVREENECVRIDIEDNGIGIEEKNLERLFERFYRVDKARSRDLGGTGLGLSIVKHIVQLHGGRLAVKSRIGQGSVFTVFLPKA